MFKKLDGKLEQMKKITLVVLTVVATDILWVPSTPAQGQLTITVQSLGINDSSYVYNKLAMLRNEPDSSIQLLIAELSPINSVTRISPEEYDRHLKEVHIIWCIRALRYLTGLDFTARTQHKFAKAEKERSYFLRDKNGQVAFFADRMSHDVLYIAPPDAQSQIISKWKAWYRKHSGHVHLNKKTDFDNWYF
ncbi:MAG TPA: hypothetical protein VIS48_00845 [Candidatus Kryptonia bacterium]